MNPQAPTLQPARPLASHSGPCFCLANPPIVCHALRTSAREGTCWPRARIATWGSSSHRFPGSSQWHRPTSFARPSSWVMCPETECRNHSGELTNAIWEGYFPKDQFKWDPRLDMFGIIAGEQEIKLPSTSINPKSARQFACWILGSVWFHPSLGRADNKQSQVTTRIITQGGVDAQRPLAQHGYPWKITWFIDCFPRYKPL